VYDPVESAHFSCPEESQCPKQPTRGLLRMVNVVLMLDDPDLVAVESGSYILLDYDVYSMWMINVADIVVASVHVEIVVFVVLTRFLAELQPRKSIPDPKHHPLSNSILGLAVLQSHIR
jgi:hypothetical protein